MGKKYFIVSDTHSYYIDLMQTLNNVGYDIENPEYVFVLCGDLFDRGDESKALLDFVKSIPKERRILIRGNHEYLLKDMMEKKFPQIHDFSNGTVKTVCELADETYYYMECSYYAEYGFLHDESIDVWERIKAKIKDSGLIDWIFSDDWIDYYEIDNLILVHSFIPLKDTSNARPYHLRGHQYSYIENWRDTPSSEWEKATWGCPYVLYDAGLFDEEIKKGKYLVCGHWHTSDFYAHYYSELGDDNYEIFHKDHLIALDGCTALSDHCNILVREETDDSVKYFDRFNNEIKI